MDQDTTPMGDQERLGNHVSRLVKAACAHRDDQQKDRETALEYYRGEMKDLPAQKGRSSVTSNDVRATIKKVMPSITRAILGGDTIVQYDPVGPEDEEGAQQATDYVNHVVIPECGAIDAIHDAIHDACLLKTGIIKWTAYETKEAKIYDFTDQPDEAMVGLEGEPDIEIIDHEMTPETLPELLEANPEAMRHSFKIKRVTAKREVKLESVARGSFLITPGADSIDEAELTGEEMVTTRSQLVAWGYDRDLVTDLTTFSGEESDEESRKGDDYSTQLGDTATALEEVLIYELYVRMDTDGDGIAEMHRVVYGEGKSDSQQTSNIILAHEQVDASCYADVVVERDPHEFEGHSVYEDTRDVQRVKTAVLRGVLDNIYATNSPRPAVNMDAAKHPEDFNDWTYGKPIRLKGGQKISDVLQWAEVPSVVSAAWPVMSYMDEIAKDRTGITDASGGVDPEAFQNTSATAAHLMSESGIAQADAIIRSVARCLGKAFKGLLGLVIAHADAERTIRVKGQWVTYDPRVWNSAMDCTVNVGLGGGTKERDLAILQIVLGLQREIMGALGPDNPLVKPDQLYNTLAKITETAGFANSDKFFTQPDQQDIARRQQEAGSKPTPEQEKLQAQMQMDQAKLSGQMQLEQARLQTQVSREQAQMQADLQVKQAEIQAKTQENAEKQILAREQMAQDGQIAMARIRADLAIAGAKMAP